MFFWLQVGGVLGWVVLLVLAVVILGFILIYNGLITSRNRVENAWSQIDVQLKRRADLIPNLVETVKGYAKHEKSVFENVTKARAQMLGASSVHDKAVAENMLAGALKSLFAVAEAYPQLKANENFSLLQEELAGTESKVAFARQFYNDNVQVFNTSLEVFPSNLVAGLLRLQSREYFEAEEGERGPVKVKF